jgi:hypothetical protein
MLAQLGVRKLMKIKIDGCRAGECKTTFCPLLGRQKAQEIENPRRVLVWEREMPSNSSWLDRYDPPTCKKKMLFVRAEPEETRVKLRLFKCQTCPHSETDLVQYEPRFRSRDIRGRLPMGIEY